MNSPSRARAQLEQVFRGALAAVDAGRAVERALVEPPSDEADGALSICGEVLPAGRRIRVLAVGKAAGAMAEACERRAGDRIEAGLAITKDDHGARLERIELRFAGHPVPDARSEAAAREAIALLEGAAPDVATVVLLSGGASSLMACPAPGLSLADLAQTTAVLLNAGADIDELNTLRKQLSAIAGGRLARLARSERIEVLAISDVPGDRLDLIGSGPFVADPSTRADALAIVSRRSLAARLPAAVMAHLETSEAERVPAPTRVRTTLLATNADAVAAARLEAAACGMRPVVLSELLSGEAARVGARVVALAAAARRPGADARPFCLIGGGETSVTVRGAGRGGRNQELALAAAIAMQGRSGLDLLAAGTDGGDGATPAAGAFVDGGTVERGRCAGRDAEAALAENDSYGFFEAVGGLLVTGPTGTNVMDLLLFRVDPAAR